MNKLPALFLLVVLAQLFACKTIEKARKKDLKSKETSYLLNQMEQNKLQFENLNFKAKVQFKSENESRTFNANFRLRKDSALWIYISKSIGINIEIARVLITTDSVKVINKLKNEYFIGDYGYINKRFNLDLEFQLLQALLIGNPIDLESNDELNFATDQNNYFLGNLKKRKAKKAERKPQKIERKDDEVFSVWLRPEDFKLSKVLVSDLSADRFLQGEYSDFFEKDGQKIPQKLFFNFQSENPSTIEMNYSRIEFNEKLSFPFKISDNYEQVIY